MGSLDVPPSPRDRVPHTHWGGVRGGLVGNLQSPGNKEAALDKYNNQNEDLSGWAQQQNKQEREETTH